MVASHVYHGADTFLLPSDFTAICIPQQSALPGVGSGAGVNQPPVLPVLQKDGTYNYIQYVLLITINY